MRALTIQVPDDLGSKDTQQLEALAREALIVKLYEQGEISSGYAADILGLSRRPSITDGYRLNRPPHDRSGHPHS